jgi:putative ABC transport system permease protein
LIDIGHHAIPLHARYQARGSGIIGTTLSYFEHRKLQIDHGRNFTTLGECVIGSEVAQNASFKVGETVITTPAGAFDVAGSFPLKMKIVGVLKSTGTPDDQVIFTDLKTSWLIAGLAHGHQDVVTGPDTLLLSSTDSSVVANAAVLSYTEVTPENLDSFHFHGDLGQYPIDAVMVIPESRRENIQLRGRFEERSDNVQMIVPRTIIDELVSTMFTVKDSIIAAAIVIGMATAVIVGLVFWLSIKLRHKEIETMKTMGGAKGTINTILGLEIGSILVVSVLLSIVFTLIFEGLALSWIENWITG